MCSRYRPGETDGYTASDHIKAILDHAGPGSIDIAVINVQEVAPDLQEIYAGQGAYPVLPDIEAIEALGIKVVKANLISETNLVRHDPARLSRTIMSMVYDLRINSDRMRLLDYYIMSESIKKLKD